MLNRLAAAAAVCLAVLPPAAAAGREAAAMTDGDPGFDISDWSTVEAAAKGQTVDWYAWGGEEHINDYIDWVGMEVSKRYGIALNHVKVADAAQAVARILAETAAGQTEDGAVDLVWVNGGNFSAMKENGLLLDSGWAEALPNRELVDMAGYGASIREDFGVPVEGQESPWGRTQLVFIYDKDRTENPPSTLDELIAFTKEYPGRFTYPEPPDFIGNTFLKQILAERMPDRSVLAKPAGEDAADVVAEYLLPVLKDMQPSLWREGKAFPTSVTALRQLFIDGEVLIALTGNPSDTLAGINDRLLPPGSEVATFANGSMGNVHFVAVPANAGDKAGALVVANFLLSPEAQAHKADPKVWGDPTVLAVDRLLESEQAEFPDEVKLLAPTLPEPHVSWTTVIERVWNGAFSE